MVPLKIGPYSVLDRIREGGLGVVWRVRDEEGRIRALKQLRREVSVRSHARRMFQREVSIGRRLRHENLLTVLDGGSDGALPYLVMEYFQSEHLQFAVHRLSAWVRGREFRILRQVAAALEYLHKEGIVHRDVKPENVLVSEHADVRLIDFSLAQTRWDRLVSFSRRREGTPRYMSPEQIRGERCDRRSDIYSFGVLVYVLLSGRSPFVAGRADELNRKHLEEHPEPLSTFAGRPFGMLDGLVARMLAKRREDRPSDLAEAVYLFEKMERRRAVSFTPATPIPA